ncbi:hypothetical protein LTR56_022165 [Elasticomyces elasticus]|nr:hypothetical protein LTR56_022165 [Elasticomyces elasticus]KAK3628622.1 hypothetical protein LTR22_022307 [Elasticomyces elasticus]KAK4913413.1 hypothetical protein LTR49_018301 [Elasticomyces elasticus]KAK5754619.1 hypothetical protein LTS12_015343 [Elasticomyces elasticus]
MTAKRLLVLGLIELITPILAQDTPTLYTVYPKNSSDLAATEGIFAQLAGIAGDPYFMFNSSKEGVRANFWQLQLAPSNATEVSKNQDVLDVYEACNAGCIFGPTPPTECTDSCYDPTSSIVRQRDAGDEMAFISQEEGHALTDYAGNYYFDSTAGAGVTVYILDSGADLTNSEFRPVSVRWIPAGNGNFEETDSSVYIDANGLKGGKGHGTCMLSRATGNVYGTSKNVDAVLARVPPSPAEMDWIDGLEKILEDAETNGGSNKVLSLSIYWPLGTLRQSNIDSMAELLKKIVATGVFVVVGTGNGATTSIEGYPAGFARASDSNYIPEMLVVGALNPTTGLKWASSNEDLNIDITYAPGEKVHCADTLSSGIKETSGTSPAAATVAGLAAYFIGLGTSGSDVKALIQDNSYERVQSDDIVRAIWNGVKFGDIPAVDIPTANATVATRVPRRGLGY